jgi:flagellar hook-associated protein 3 FlgL
MTTVMSDSTIQNIHRNAGAVQQLQLKQATGKEINTPSDDPLAFRRALHLQNVDRRFEQFLQNVEEAAARINESNIALQEVTDLLMKAHDIAVRANNDVLNDEQKAEIANEIDQILEQLVRLGNTTRDGEFIFSGTLKDTQAFDVERDQNGEIVRVIFNGNNKDRDLNIGPDQSIATNLGGGLTFQKPGADVFQSLIDLRDNLRSGKNVLQDIGSIRDSMNHVLDQVTELNSRIQILELTRGRLESAQTLNLSLLSQTEDADLAQTILDIQRNQNILQASLAVGANVIPPSLLQFL